MFRSKESKENKSKYKFYMTTDDLREKYDKKIHFNCKNGDEAFTDGYVLFLEELLIEIWEE
jgi:hypothetical protein